MGNCAQCATISLIPPEACFPDLPVHLPAQLSKQIDHVDVLVVARFKYLLVASRFDWSKSRAMRLLCFFGSGVSQPSDMPMSKEITAALFNGQWHKHTDGLFYSGPGGSAPNGTDVVSSVQGFLKVLNKAAAVYLKRRSAGLPNYEHLFSLAQTIKDDISDESFNPAIGDFVDKISRRTETL